MRSSARAALLTLLAPLGAHAGDGTFLQGWPPRWNLPGEHEFVLSGNAAYDINEVLGEAGPLLTDAHGWRRREFGFGFKRKGVYDLGASFDFASRTWMDVALRVETRALIGRDLGRARIGQTKLPLGFEGNTATRNSLFLENALPTQAFYPGRRLGLDWALERPTYLVNAGYYGNDLQGNNRGRVLAGRVAWTPRKAAGDVVHVGLAGTRERPEGEIDGRGVTVPASARWRARPEAGLTSTRLVDSGTLAFAERVERLGVEALWVRGAWSMQAEHMGQRTQRAAGPARYTGDGGYVAASWIVTGESRVYSGGNVANPLPARALGALELTARRSWIDLDDAGIAGGQGRNWTVGANWYPNRHLKLQVNYVRADATRGAARTDIDFLLVRVQTHF